MSRSPVSPKPLTGGMVLLMLVVFFGVVFGVNGLLATLAIQTLPGTEVDSAYSASLGYAKEITAARDQDARAWKVNAHVQRAPDGGAGPIGLAPGRACLSRCRSGSVGVVDRDRYRTDSAARRNGRPVERSVRRFHRP